MIIKVILGYILGYVKISIEGYFVERFINICVNQNILLWNIKRKNKAILIANISIIDFKKVRKINKKTKCKINILAKQGLPFLFNKYKKRKVFVVLMGIVTVSIIVTSNYVWNIEIKGVEDDLKIEMEQILKETGLEIGKLKSKIDTKKIINEIRLKRDDIAWIGIEREGTNAIVEIVKASPKPEIVKEDEYCNIVSNKSGIITKINVQNGTAIVKEGDLVKEGTILVGGYLEGKYTGTRYVHAKADIEAKVWYSKSETVNLKQEVKERTRETENKYGIRINNFEINFYKTLSKFKNYDTIVTDKKIMLFSNFYLPIEVIKTTNYETKIEEVEYSVEELKEITIEKLEKEIEDDIENKENILNKQVNFYEKQDSINVEVIYEVLENIGTEEKIVF